jgi:4-carboxymuconolactone decarboxylase
MTYKEVPRVAPPEVHDTAPALGWYSDYLLFDSIWNRPNLSRRDRSIVTVALLVACGHYAQLQGHTRRALDHGVTPVEIVEIVTHLAFYAGWPNAMSSLKIVRETFAQRNIDLASIGQSISNDVDLGKVRSKGIKAFADPLRKDAFSSCLDDCTEAVLHDDLWRRPDLAVRDRALATIAALIGTGCCDMLLEHVRNALELEVTIAELCELVAHSAFYIGYPKARRAAHILDPLSAMVRLKNRSE